MPRPDPLRAVIFDLDGVLTDTAHLHFLAWRALAESIGLPFDEAFNERLKGVDRIGSLALILAQDPSRRWTEAERLTLAARKNAHYQRLLGSLGPNDLLAGAAEALRACRAAGLRMGLASVSHNAPTVLRRLGITDRFDHVVDARSIARGKPDPEIFLRAAAALGVPPAECVGVEDAQAGIDAIKAAGMYAVGVGRAGALRGADEVVDGLAALNSLLEPAESKTRAQTFRHRQEMTTVEAANFLNVSRPFVIKEIEAKRLPHRMVGTHRRILFKDLLEYSQSMRRRQQEALDDMADDAIKNGLYD